MTTIASHFLIIIKQSGPYHGIMWHMTIHAGIISDISTHPFRLTTVTGIIYALIIEGVISFVPAVISKMTISYHLRMMYLKILDDGDRAQIFRRLNIDFSEYTAWKLWAIMIVVTIVLLALTSLVVTSREYNKNQPGQ